MRRCLLYVEGYYRRVRCREWSLCSRIRHTPNPSALFERTDSPAVADEKRAAAAAQVSQSAQSVRRVKAMINCSRLDENVVDVEIDSQRGADFMWIGRAPPTA